MTAPDIGNGTDPESDAWLTKVTLEAGTRAQQRSLAIMKQFVTDSERAVIFTQPISLLLSEVIALRICKEFTFDLLKDEIQKLIQPDRDVNTFMQRIDRVLDRCMANMMDEFNLKLRKDDNSDGSR